MSIIQPLWMRDVMWRGIGSRQVRRGRGGEKSFERWGVGLVYT